MELRLALEEQYRAGLAMLAQCAEGYPDDLWVSTGGQEKTEGGQGEGGE